MSKTATHYRTSSVAQPPEWWTAYRAELIAHGHPVPHCWENVPIARSLPPLPSMHHSERVALVYQSSGTTGTPKTIAYSRTEWEQAVRARAWCLQELGVSAGHRVALALPFGPWFSGDNISDALVHLDAMVLPCGLYEPHLRGLGNLVRSMAFDTLITTPSIARALLVHEGISAIKWLITVGEALPTALRAELETGFGCRISSLFACSEGVIGYRIEDNKQAYTWNPEFVHLEVVREDGAIASVGTGELLLTVRHRHLQPVMRLALGDLVTLEERQFIFHGRKGHAFTLATGVKVARADLEAFLDSLPFNVSEAIFQLEHAADGKDHLSITLHTDSRKDASEKALAILLANNMDIRDAMVSGLVRIDVKCHPHTNKMVRKRHIAYTEAPWCL